MERESGARARTKLRNKRGERREREGLEKNGRTRRRGGAKEAEELGEREECARDCRGMEREDSASCQREGAK